MLPGVEPLVLVARTIRGESPPDPEMDSGWLLEVASKRAEIVVVAKVVRFGWIGANVELEVSEVLKGRPRDRGALTVSTRYIPGKAAGLKRGGEYLFFYIDSPDRGNPVSQVFEKTKENIQGVSLYAR